jgi:hypothetical protein
MKFPEKRLQVMPEVVICLRFAWWFVPYLKALALMCLLMGTEPDYEKVARMAQRALRVRVNNMRWLSSKAWLRRYG